jgi:predicted transcriptional regulator
MSHKSLNIRVSTDLAARLEAMRPTLERKPEYAGRASISVSEVARLALALGVAQLEREAAAAGQEVTSHKP